MKRILTLLVFSCSLLTTFAQNVYICKDGSYTKTSITNGMEIDLTAGIDSITFSKPDMLPTVKIVYSGTTATVTIPEDISEYVTCSSGNSSNVVITNTNTTEEYAYALSGSSTAGSLTITADYKMTVKLNGVSLTANKGAAIDLQCGKRIDLIMGDGTTNTLVDFDGSEDHKGCLTTKGHFEMSGAGTLNVTGNYYHAIRAKEYILLKKSVGTINILKAGSDAIHVGQYFQMNGGTINIDKNTENDGIQVEYKTDDSDNVIPLSQDADNTGNIIIKGGTLNITMGGDEDTKGLKAEGDVIVSGGTFNINAQSNGSRGIQASGDMTISEDDNPTIMTINATGEKCTKDVHKTDPHKCWGIKIDGTLTVYGGNITVYKNGTTSKKGISCDTYIKKGGTVNATIKEDE